MKQLETWLRPKVDNVDGNESKECGDGGDAASRGVVDRELIIKCALHCDLRIRMEALEVICASKLSTDIPGPNTLDAVRAVIPHLIKLQTSNHRDQFIQLIQKLLLRMNRGVYKLMRDKDKRIKKRLRKRTDIVLDGDAMSIFTAMIDRDDSDPEMSWFQRWSATLRQEQEYSLCVFDALDEADRRAVVNCFDFIEWFRSWILHNLYPGAPVERTSTAISMYYFLLNIWARDLLEGEDAQCTLGSNVQKETERVVGSKEVTFPILQSPWCGVLSLSL